MEAAKHPDQANTIPHQSKQRHPAAVLRPAALRPAAV